MLLLAASLGAQRQCEVGRDRGRWGEAECLGFALLAGVDVERLRPDDAFVVLASLTDQPFTTTQPPAAALVRVPAPAVPLGPIGAVIARAPV